MMDSSMPVSCSAGIGPLVGDSGEPSNLAGGRAQSMYGFGGGKVARQRRYTQRAQNPYSRPLTGRHAAAGPLAAAAAAGLNAAKQGQGAGLQIDPVKTDIVGPSHASRKGWLSGVGSSLTNFITWSWGSQRSAPAREDQSATPGHVAEGAAREEPLELPEGSPRDPAGPRRREQFPGALEHFLQQQKSQGLSLTSDQFSRIVAMLKENVVDPVDTRSPGRLAAELGPWGASPSRTALPQVPTDPAVRTSTPSPKGLVTPDPRTHAPSWQDAGFLDREDYFTPPGVSEGDGDSPVELARTFMGRPATPVFRSVLYPALRPEGGQRVAFVDPPARDRELREGDGSGPRRLLEARQATPFAAARVRIALRQPPMTPRPLPSQWSDGVGASQSLARWTPIQAPLTGGRELLKRRRTMLDDGWASVGPLRRTRQRASGALLVATRAAVAARPLPVRPLSLPDPSTSLISSQEQDFEAPEFGRQLNVGGITTRYRGDVDADGLGPAEEHWVGRGGGPKLPPANTPFGSVPMQSSETARRILETLDQISPERPGDGAGRTGAAAPLSLMRLGSVSERSRRSMLTPEPPPPLYSLEGGDAAPAANRRASEGGPTTLAPEQFRAADKAAEQAKEAMEKGKGKVILAGESETAADKRPLGPHGRAAQRPAAGNGLDAAAAAGTSQPGRAGGSAVPSPGGFRMSAIEDDRDGEPEDSGAPLQQVPATRGATSEPSPHPMSGPPLIAVPLMGGSSDAKPFSFVAPPASENAATPKLRATSLSGANGPGSGAVPGPTFHFTSDKGLPSFASLPGAAEQSAHVKGVPSFTFQSSSTSPSLAFSAPAQLAGAAAVSAPTSAAQPTASAQLPSSSLSGAGLATSAKPSSGTTSLPPLFSFGSAAAAAPAGAAEGSQATPSGAFAPATASEATRPAAAVASFFAAFQGSSKPLPTFTSPAPGASSTSPSSGGAIVDVNSSATPPGNPPPLAASFFGGVPATAASGQGSGAAAGQASAPRPGGVAFGGLASSPFGSPTGASPRPTFPPVALPPSVPFQFSSASPPPSASEGAPAATLGQKRGSDDSDNPSKRRSSPSGDRDTAPATAAPAGASIFGAALSAEPSGSGNGTMPAAAGPAFGAPPSGQGSSSASPGAPAAGLSTGPITSGTASLSAPTLGLFGKPSPEATSAPATSSTSLFSAGAFSSFGGSSAPAFGAGFGAAAATSPLFGGPSTTAPAAFGGSTSAAPLFTSFGAGTAAPLSSSGVFPAFGASSAATAGVSPSPFSFSASSAGPAQTAPLQAAAFPFGGGSVSGGPAGANTSAPAFAFGGGAPPGGGFLFSAGQSSAGSQSGAFTFTASQPTSTALSPAFGQQPSPVFGLARNSSLASDGSPNTMEDSMGEEPLSPPKAAPVFGTPPPASGSPFVFGQTPTAASGPGASAAASPAVFSFGSGTQGQPQNLFGQAAAAGNTPFGAPPATGGPAPLFNAGAGPVAFSMGAGDGNTNISGRRILKVRRPSGAARKR